MALGGVGIVPFTTAELTENFGTVNTVPCTRAEFLQMLLAKAYPDGRVVWSKVNPSPGSFDLSDVNYIIFDVDETSVKVARGSSATLYGTLSYTLYGDKVSRTASFQLEFKDSGTLIYTRSSWSLSSGATNIHTPTVALTGYHYY